MSKEIVKQETNEMTVDKVVNYLDAFGLSNSLEKNEQQQFIEIATAFNLNPFKREIYCIPFMAWDNEAKAKKRKLSIITGYEVYLKRAERLNALNGWNVKTDGTRKDNTLKAIVTIYRKDWQQPFTHEVYFVEYNQDNKIWKSKPITMIKKVAIAQAFRLCFPDDLGGLPHTADEIPDNMTKEPINITPEEACESEKVYKSAVDKLDTAIEQNPEDDDPENNYNNETPEHMEEVFKALIKSQYKDKDIFSSAEKIAKSKVFLKTLKLGNIEEAKKLLEIFEDVKQKRISKLMGE